MKYLVITLWCLLTAIPKLHAQTCTVQSCDLTVPLKNCGATFCQSSDCTYSCGICASTASCSCNVGTAITACGGSFSQNYDTCTYTCLSQTPASTGPPPTPASPPSKQGCIANHQIVTVQGFGNKQIKNLTIGDNVYTDSGFKKYIGNIHDSAMHHTLILHTKNGLNIEVTRDHLVKANGKFVQAYMVKTGDIITTTHGYARLSNISNGTSEVSSPLTQSGTIVVNDFVLSCYATDRPHDIVNLIFYPVRSGLVKSASRYFRMLINIHNTMPKWSKAYISSYSVTL